MTRPLRISLQAHEVVARALLLVGETHTLINVHGEPFGIDADADAEVHAHSVAVDYILGTGGRNPLARRPWTKRNGRWGADCVGAGLWAQGLDRFQPTFTEYGGWINTDSAIREAQRNARWFEIVTLDRARIGDSVVWGSVYKDGRRVVYGHWGTVVGRQLNVRAFRDLLIVHCSSSGAVAVKRQYGGMWDHHPSFVLRTVHPVEASP